MSDSIKYVVGWNAENVSVIPSSSQEMETALLCKNSLISIGLKHLLAGTQFSITNAASDAAFFSLSYPDASPALFILDGSDTPSYIVDTAKTLKDRYPEARIAVIADGFDLGFIKLARSAGVDGFCLSASVPEVLTTALELVMLGEAVLPTSVMTLLLDLAPINTEQMSQDKDGVGLEWSDPRLRKLSSRESQILHCLTDGAPNKVIARKLDVAEATVKVHVKSILRKIGAANRTQAAMWAAAQLPTNVGSSLGS
jgi:two-component system, NarL family, nitrate/nitrite response regulator NarL